MSGLLNDGSIIGTLSPNLQRKLAYASKPELLQYESFAEMTFGLAQDSPCIVVDAM